MRRVGSWVVASEVLSAGVPGEPRLATVNASVCVCGIVVTSDKHSER